MNQYIKAQINSMLIYVNTFEDACKIASLKDDGIMSKQEEKLLKKIDKINQDYKKELTKLVEKEFND